MLHGKNWKKQIDLNRTYPWRLACPCAVFEWPCHQPSVSNVLVGGTEVVVYGCVQVFGDAVDVDHRIL